MELRERIKFLLRSKSDDFNNMICLEELSELQKEISKMYRGIGKRENLIEEIVDVAIVLNMLEQMYDITEEELKEEMRRKMSRNIERVENEKIRV